MKMDISITLTDEQLASDMANAGTDTIEAWIRSTAEAIQDVAFLGMAVPIRFMRYSDTPAEFYTYKNDELNKV